MRVSYKQKGFSATEVVVALLLVAVIGLLVYVYVDQTNNKDVEVTQQPTTDKADTDSVKTKDDSSVSSLAVVEQFYVDYLQRAEDESSAVDFTNLKGEFPKYISDAASKQVSENQTSVNPVVCAQNIPSSFTYSKPQIDGTKAKITVTGAFEEGSSTTYVEVDTKSNKIISFACEQ